MLASHEDVVDERAAAQPSTEPSLHEHFASELLTEIQRAGSLEVPESVVGGQAGTDIEASRGLALISKLQGRVDNLSQATIGTRREVAEVRNILNDIKTSLLPTDTDENEKVLKRVSGRNCETI